MIVYGMVNVPEKQEQLENADLPMKQIWLESRRDPTKPEHSENAWFPIFNMWLEMAKVPLKPEQLKNE